MQDFFFFFICPCQIISLTLDVETPPQNWDRLCKLPEIVVVKIDIDYVKKLFLSRHLDQLCGSIILLLGQLLCKIPSTTKMIVRLVF